jgi:hypothetical protein
LLKAANQMDAGDPVKACAAMREGAAKAGIRKMVVFAAKEPVFNWLLRICHRDFENAVRSIGHEAVNTIGGPDTVDYLVGKADMYHTIGDTISSRVYFDSVRAWLEKTSKANPGVGVWHMYLGWAYGGLGKKDMAVREWSWFKKPMRSAKRAETYLMLGMKEEALQWLESGAGGRIRGAWITADPLWAPYRSDPRFEKAVALAK